VAYDDWDEIGRNEPMKQNSPERRGLKRSHWRVFEGQYASRVLLTMVKKTGEEKKGLIKYLDVLPRDNSGDNIQEF
jgi:hypothetical protein